MRIEDWSLQQINITVVFENIDKDLIRRDHIRRTFDGEEVIITDFPDLLAVILPKKEAQANYHERRLHVNTPNKNDEDSPAFLAHACVGLVESVPERKIKAYGFNLNGKCKTSSEIDVNKHLLEVCFGGGRNLARAIEADITSAAPSFTFEKYDARFNVSLRPSEQDQNELVFHCNIHFDLNEIPDENEIKSKVIRYSDYFKEILEKL